jgi:hypothetical protein
MSTNNETKSKRRLSAKVTAGIAISAMLTLASFAGPAYAGWSDRDDRGDHHDVHHDDHRGDRNDWHGSYYAPPPVVYGGPYAGPAYYAPPVVYGPAVGVNLPGVTIGIF